MNFLSRTKRLKEKERKLAEEENELKKLEILNRKQQEEQEKRNRDLIERRARKLANERIALAEVQLENEARKARKKAEDLRNDAAYQERMRITAERNLLFQQHKNEAKLREQEQQAMVMDVHQKRLLADERRARELAEQRLQDELAVVEARRLQKQEDLRRAEAEEREHIRQLEEAQAELEEKLRNEERRRQRDEVQNGNSTKALRDLRELIRTRYELDMDIWQNRNDLPANRPLWQRKMVQADAILLEIQSKVQKWDNANDASGWTPEEWEMAKDIKERLLANGKRNWAKDPPWTVGERKPPKITRERGKKKSTAKPTVVVQEILV